MPSEPRMVVVAQFAGTHGVRGEFKLRSYTEEPEDVFEYGELTAPGGQSLRPSFVRALKPSMFLCRAEGFSSPEALLDAFKGALLSVPRDVLPPTEDDDDFYIEDLVGLEARTPDGVSLGKVRTVQNYGAGDVMEIKGAGGLVLLPFTKEAVPGVHIEEGFLTVVPEED
ncbi:ribosome maturation factor RimM [Parvularcula maris]|uniref:Ribosome maturation factor RimM n=1 Tax=Parvularcula maris TaxID=2965077 RepID=A0A9X2RID7_9PROT|nr:ribosome maturation factor RimM [Parvularcula maris]MCQ8183797.1 ribosome maturation factor RimM [Parvularcula maris]